MRRFSIIILIFAVIIYGSNDSKLAQTGFQFLSVSSDARAGGMADAMTTLTNGSASLFFNPAGLSKQTSLMNMNFSSNNWIADIKHDAFSISIAPNKSRYGVFGLSLLNVDYGQLQGTVVWDNELGYLDTEKFSPSALALGFGYGKSLSENFSIGMHIKKAYQQLGRSVVPATDSSSTVINNTSNAIAFDFGTIYVTEWNDFTFGMSVRNFSEEPQYAFDSFQLPLTFRIGGSINAFGLFPTLNDNHSFIIAAEAQHPRSYSERINLGAEYSFKNIASIRFGYLHNYDEQNITFGAGLMIGPLKIDYAHTPFGIFDSVNRISIGLSR